MTKSFTYYLPTQVIAGPGEISALPDLAKPFGRNLLVVIPPDLKAITTPILENLTANDLNITPLEIEACEPTISFINGAASKLREKTFDAIIAIGGGSAMDVGKALSIGLGHEEDIWLYANLSGRPALPLKAPIIPVICVATTSGTGSEVTPYAVLTKEETNQKGTIQEPAIFPKIAILDPELIVGLPPHLTASTGLDAFAHALEATINISKHSPAAETFGLSAMKKIFKWLPIAYREPDNIKARMKLSWASNLAGMAISHRGTTTAHAIAEPLGVLTHIPHGLGVSLATLPVLRHSLDGATGVLARLNQRVLGGVAKDDAQHAKNFILALEELFQAVDMTKPAKDYINNQNISSFPDVLVENIMKFKFRPLKQHPVEFEGESLKPIVTEMIFGPIA